MLKSDDRPTCFKRLLTFLRRRDDHSGVTACCGKIGSVRFMIQHGNAADQELVAVQVVHNRFSEKTQVTVDGKKNSPQEGFRL